MNISNVYFTKRKTLILGMQLSAPGMYKFLPNLVQPPQNSGLQKRDMKQNPYPVPTKATRKKKYLPQRPCAGLFVHFWCTFTVWVKIILTKKLFSSNAYFCTVSYSARMIDSFSGAFAKLRKETISVVMSVCRSISMETLGFHCRNFKEI